MDPEPVRRSERRQGMGNPEAAFGKKMDEVLDTIAAELRGQYSIGYYPTHPVKDGKWHRVRIRMKNPDYVARARKEYLDK